MSFPHKTWYGRKKGWKDLGRAGKWAHPMTGTLYDYRCTGCGGYQHIGIDAGGRFRFCPRCLIRVDK